MRRRLLIVLTGLAALTPRPVVAGDAARWAVVIEGASGDPAYAAQHRAWVDALVSTLRNRCGIESSRLTVLTEDPRAGEARGTAENVKAAFARIATEARADDLVFVMLIGHGSGAGAAAKFNLVGPDLTVAEWAAMLQPIPARLAIVNSTSASVGFLAGLSGANRVVITATNSPAQVYHTVFPGAFIQALASSDADADQNGRVSLFEAFDAASRAVARHYEEAGRLATEHAVFNDTGDGAPHDTASGAAGVVAGLTYLDAVAAPRAADPGLQALLVRQQALVDEIDVLRRRRPSMAAEDFDREFERLIVDLALVSRDVRRRTGKV